MSSNNIVATLALFISLAAPAESLDPSVLEAILGTQQTLTDPKSREKAANTPQSKAALGEVSAVAGNAENAEAIFALSAEIFAELAKQTKGDPAKMEKILEKARNNPSEFAETFSPAIKAKLGEIAKKIPTPPNKSLP